MMKINQMEPVYGIEEKLALADYLNLDGWLTEYKKTEELEKMIAKYTGTKYCSMVTNGTVSLFCALKAYDIGPGDEVLCPDYTMIATANAISLTGAKPIFVDVEKYTLGIGGREFAKLMLNKSIKKLKKLKAVMLVSINGRYPLVATSIISYCKKNNIVVIEDAAQSLGSFYNKKHLGTFGDIGSFSFSMPKIITTGQGGCLVTNNKETYDKIEMIKDFGRVKSGVDYHKTMGWNFKFTDLQAVIGIEQMKKLPFRVKRKRAIYKLYRDLLEGTKGIEFIDTDLSQTTPWMNDILVKNRQKLVEHLTKKEVGTRHFYPAIHSQAPYKWVVGDFPNSTHASKHGLWLPSSVALTDEEIEYVCKSIKEVK